MNLLVPVNWLLPFICGQLASEKLLVGPQLYYGISKGLEFIQELEAHE